MQIEFGKWYERRDGVVVGPAVKQDDELYPWSVGDDDYTIDGRYYFSISGENNLDLIKGAAVARQPTTTTTTQITIINPDGEEIHIGGNGAVSHAQGHIATAAADGKRIAIRVEEVVK